MPSDELKGKSWNGESARKSGESADEEVEAAEPGESQSSMLGNDVQKEESDVEIPDDGIPYDKGWAWMIVLAGFVNFVIMAGYSRSTFIFFVNFLEEFRAPVTETALLYGVKAGINSIVGLFIMNAVVGRFGVRRTVVLGGICLSLSAILGSFATDLTSLIMSQAVFHGLGTSMLGMPTTILLGYYFRRRRSLANSLTRCGVGVGSVAFPPMVTLMLDNYGLRGSLLLVGGICLHVVVTALLLRPVSFYRKRTPRRLSSSQSEDVRELVESDLAATITASCNDGTSSSDAAGAGSSGAVDYAARKKARNNGTVLEDRATASALRTGGAAVVPRGDLTNDSLSVATFPGGNKTKPVRTIRTVSSEDGATNEASGRRTVLEGSVATIEASVIKDAFPGDGVTNESVVTGPSVLEDGVLLLSGGVRAERGGRGAARADKGFLFDKDDDRGKDIRDARSQNGSRDGSHAVAVRRIRLPYGNDVIALSRSAPEVYSKRPCLRRTVSHKEEFKRSRPEVRVSLLDTLSRSPLTRYLSKPDVDHDSLFASQLLDQRQGKGGNTPTANRTCPQATWSFLRRAASVLDFSLFHSPMFRMMVVFFIFSPLGQTGPAYLPAMAKERHLDETQRATLLSIIGGLDFFCRLACGFLADTKLIKASTMICIAFTVLGAANQLTRLLLTFDLLIILTVAQGLFGGVAACVMPIVVMEDIGLENTAKAFGFQKLVSGAAMAVFHPMLGYIRDVTGSYDAVYNVIGAFNLLSAAAIVCMSFLPHRLPGRNLEATAVLY